MSETAIRPNSPRVTIAAASHHGLILQIDREKLELPWTGVRGVTAGHVPAAAGAWHLALALALDVEAVSLEHLLIATEADRVWAALTAVTPGFSRHASHRRMGARGARKFSAFIAFRSALRQKREFPLSIESRA